jgi:hypothetical protein
LIPPVTFDRVSGKFPPMKAWIYICAIVFAAGMVTALADETKTNTQTGATMSIPANTNEVAVPPPMTTSPSAPAVAGEVRPPDDVSLMQTGAVPAQSNITAAPPSESSGIGRKGVLAISVAFLAVVSGLTVFMLRRQRKADHASLITRAMNENKDEDKDTGKHEEKREDKKEDKKFPPPLT